MNTASFVAEGFAVRRLSPTSRWMPIVSLRINQLLALMALAAFSPLMLVVSALLLLADGWPLFYGHYRVGQDGRLFRCLKFRTMRRDSDRLLRELLARDATAREEWARDQKLRRDPRVTSIGHFLRKTSLDELPQLWNVVRGEMRLVGPRPVTVPELNRYGRVRWHYLSVPPGITGLWQVSGRNDTTYDERVALDREYVESRSLWLDASILLKTIRVVLLREGAR